MPRYFKAIKFIFIAFSLGNLKVIISCSWILVILKEGFGSFMLIEISSIFETVKMENKRFYRG